MVQLCPQNGTRNMPHGIQAKAPKPQAISFAKNKTKFMFHKTKQI
jgi:hypothetical protein